jgi:hypothetical protein
MISFSSHPFANLFTTFFFYRRNERIVMGNWNGFNNQTILSWIPIETKFFWLPKNSSFYYYFFVGFSIKFPHFLIQINSTSHLQNDKWKRSFFFIILYAYYTHVQMKLHMILMTFSTNERWILIQNFNVFIAFIDLLFLFALPLSF